MKQLLIQIGYALSALTLLLTAGAAHAAQSTSYTLESNFNNDTTNVDGTATDYAGQGEVTWRQNPLTSQSFEIVPFIAGSSAISAASSVPQAGSSESTTPIGGHRGSSASSISSLHGAAGSSSSAPALRSRPPHRFSSSITSVTSAASVTSSSSSSSSASSFSSAFIGSAAIIPIGSGALCIYAPLTTVPPVNVTVEIAQVALALWRILLAAIAGALIAIAARRKKKADIKTRRAKVRVWTIRIGLIAIAAVFLAIAIRPTLLTSLIPYAHAEQSVPSTRVYNGHLLDSSGKPVTTPVTIRFSEWSSTDFVTSDLTSTGAINTGAPNYLGWQETHTVTPDSNGYFSITLGEQSPLPESHLTTAQLQSMFLQVDVKASTSPDTSFELLDVDPNDATKDRTQIFPTSLTRNADFLDQHDTGTGSGSIPVLGSGGVLPVSTVPGGTNADMFTLDDNNTATGSVTLEFGKLLQKMLSYDQVNHWFNFNDSVHIQGDLNVTGLVNGLDLSQLQSSTDTYLKTTSGAGLTVKVGAGNYRINGKDVDFIGSGGVVVKNNTTNYLFFTATGMTINTTGFPTDKSYIPLSSVTTSGGTVRTVQDQRLLSNDDREQTGLKVLHPAYEGASFQADGSDNVGQLFISTDNLTLKNFYDWTSTRSTLQDYDILVRVTLPPDFKAWTASGITLQYRSTSAATTDNKLDIQVYDTNGVPVTLVGSASNLASTSWAQTTLTFSGSPTWTAGQEFMVRLKVSAQNNFQMEVGDMKLNYTQFQKTQ